jgi:hypothetical protein
MVRRLDWLKVKHSKWPIDGQFNHRENEYNFPTRANERSDEKKPKNPKISPDVHFYGNKFSNASQNNTHRNLTPVETNDRNHQNENENVSENEASILESDSKSDFSRNSSSLSDNNNNNNQENYSRRNAKGQNARNSDKENENSAQHEKENKKNSSHSLKSENKNSKEFDENKNVTNRSSSLNKSESPARSETSILMTEGNTANNAENTMQPSKTKMGQHFGDEAPITTHSRQENPSTFANQNESRSYPGENQQEIYRQPNSNKKRKSKCNKKLWLLILLLICCCILVILALALGLYFGLRNQNSSSPATTQTTIKVRKHFC